MPEKDYEIEHGHVMVNFSVKVRKGEDRREVIEKAAKEVVSTGNRAANVISTNWSCWGEGVG